MHIQFSRHAVMLIYRKEQLTANRGNNKWLFFVVFVYRHIMLLSCLSVKAISYSQTIIMLLIN